MSSSSKFPTKLPYVSGKVHLPVPSGEYPVIGVHDILTGSGTDNGILVRLLYPAKDQTVDLTSTHAQWPSWYPDPKYKSSMTSIFSPRAAHLIKLLQRLGNDVHLPFIQNSDLLQPSTSTGPWPVIVFCHGLGTIRTSYSSICSQLASLGFIVAILEHRDTTAYATTYPTEDGDIEWMQHRRMDEFGPYEGTEHFEARQVQLRTRVREIRELLDMLHSLNDGTKIQNVFAENGVPGLDYSQFRGQIDTDNIIVAGHSFGGATVLFALADEPRLKVGLCLDSWMFSLRDFNAKRVKQPILFINMENFHSDQSLLKIREFVTAKAEEGEERKVFTIKKTTHTDISDLPMLVYAYPSWITSAVNWIVPVIPKVTPFSGHAAIVSLCTDFIKKHCDIDAVKNLEFPAGVHLEEGIILKNKVLQREHDENQEMDEIGQDEVDNQS